MYNILSSIIPVDRISTKEPMANHTTFKIGGPAEVYVQPATTDELIQVVKICRENDVRFFIIGNGSNILVSDEGLNAVVIQLYPHFSNCKVNDVDIVPEVTAEAGTLLSNLANTAWQAGLTGLEFASGIPGTVGGAVCMNAGAYGHEIKDVLVSADILLPNGTTITVAKDDMQLGYRTSVLQKDESARGGILLSATFSLVRGDKETIKAYMLELNGKRRETQPLQYPSAGSTFKRPPGHYAGKLIQDCGLKGYKIGGAMVSEKHAGFVINVENATAKDVTDLMTHIQTTVQNRFGVKLEPEVELLCNL